MKKKVAIIGGGIAGLSAAIRLISSGNKVTLFEKNTTTGGKANELRKEGFRFDTGPSLLTMKFVLEELFESARINTDDYIKFTSLSTLCKYHYPDGTLINAYADREKFAGEIEAKTSDKAESIKKYLRYSKRIYDLTAELFLYKSFKEPSTFMNLRALKTLLNLRSIDAFRTINEANQSFFRDTKTIQLFNRYATYNGSNPFEAPATLNIIPHVECSLGAYLPEKGIYSITEALTKVAEDLGVSIQYNCNVEKITHKEKVVKGVRVNGIEEKYDIVVAGSDVNYTYINLFDNLEIKESRKYKKLTPSSSAVVFYWGVKNYTSPLSTHNIFFSDNYKAEFDDIFKEKRTPRDPTVYVYISSKTVQGDAPEGGENWFVMTNAPYSEGQDWLNEIKIQEEVIKKKISKTLGINIEQHIRFSEVLTPPIIEAQTNSHLGSLYGISSNNRNAAFLRQGNRSGYFKNLYFCGGSAHPGGGIPLVLLSGKIASDLIRKDYD